MKRINISCGDANVLLETNSSNIIEFFLHDTENVRETIPGIDTSLVKVEGKLRKPYIIYMDSENVSVSINEKDNTAVISFPESKLFFPDLVYLVLSMLSKELNKENKYFIHSSIVEKNGKGVMIIGDPGSGKTTLSLLLSMNKGFNFVCNDRALIEFRNNIPYAVSGTIETTVRVGVIPKYFPDLLSEIDEKTLENPWKNRFYLNPLFNKIGIHQKGEAKISYVLHALTYPTGKENTRLELYDKGKKQDVAILKTLGCFSQYIRADNNMLLSMEYPFPSFDTHELTKKRFQDVKKFLSATKMYSARGNMEDLTDMIDELVV